MFDEGKFYYSQGHETSRDGEYWIGHNLKSSDILQMLNILQMIILFLSVHDSSDFYHRKSKTPNYI